MQEWSGMVEKLNRPNREHHTADYNQINRPRSSPDQNHKPKYQMGISAVKQSSLIKIQIPEEYTSTTYQTSTYPSTNSKSTH